jgi:hypothetical protein
VNLLERVAQAVHAEYRIARELGAGATATVYLAHDLKHDRLVALKGLRPELALAVGAERCERTAPASIRDSSAVYVEADGLVLRQPLRALIRRRTQSKRGRRLVSCCRNRERVGDAGPGENGPTVGYEDVLGTKVAVEHVDVVRGRQRCRDIGGDPHGVMDG